MGRNPTETLDIIRAIAHIVLFSLLLIILIRLEQVLDLSPVYMHQQQYARRLTDGTHRDSGVPV